MGFPLDEESGQPKLVKNRIMLENEAEKLSNVFLMKKCKECGKEFTVKRENQVYCSNECRFKHERKYMRDYMKSEMRERRMFEYASTLTEEQIKKFDYLIEKQQFIEDIPTNHEKTCFICGATEKLIEHHISYSPEEKVTLCRKCHSFLHNSLLARKKCRPK